MEDKKAPNSQPVNGCLVASATPSALVAVLAGGCLLSEGGLNQGRESFIAGTAFEIMVISGLIAALPIVVLLVRRELRKPPPQ